MKRLAIVPARGGSKRIKNKNIAPFCGRPMMSYVIEAAKQSGLFDTIHISTESSVIAGVAGDLGFRPDFPRPADLADDHTPLVPVLRWVTEEFGRRAAHFDEVCLLMPCAPMIEASDLIAGNRVLSDLNGTHPVLAVCPYPVPIEWAFDRQPDGLLVAADAMKQELRSQDIVEKYYDAGLFCFYTREHLLGPRSPAEIGFASTVVPRFKAVDIDTLDDWELAERICRGTLTLGAP